MRTSLECIPCFVRQTLEAVRFATRETRVHERLLREVLRAAAEMNLEQSPPAMAQQIHRKLRTLTGVDDPYRGVKDRFNRMAMAMLPEMAAEVARSDDPLATAVRLAIAGNVIDLGVDGNLTEAEAERAIGNMMHEPFAGNLDELAAAVRTAGSILYLADNAGEIVFDRLLIQQMPTDRVTVAVRGRPILNDVTRLDAEAVGLTDLVEVIDNGSDAPGTLLQDCSDAFRRRFDAADLVIAKGQGNYESLSEVPRDIFFLLKAKCSVIAEHIGMPVGTHIALGGPARAASVSDRTQPMGD